MKTIIFLVLIFQETLAPGLSNKTRDEFVSMADMIPSYFKESKAPTSYSLRQEIYRGKQFMGYKYYQQDYPNGTYWYVGSYIAHTKKYYWLKSPILPKRWN